jgi:hypothetical protein
VQRASGTVATRQRPLHYLEVLEPETPASVLPFPSEKAGPRLAYSRCERCKTGLSTVVRQSPEGPELSCVSVSSMANYRFRRCCASRPRPRDWRFPAQDSGGRRQFHLLWWQALGRISAEEHTNIFLDEPGGVIGPQDHACVKAQRRIGKRLYHYSLGMKVCRGRLRKDLQSLGAG